MKRSPLAPAHFPDMPIVQGVRFATANSGIKYTGRDDVMLALLDEGTVIAGALTTSKTRSACVEDCARKLTQADRGPAAIVVNAGNSNAFTGKYGAASVAAITQATAHVTGVQIDRIFTSSTGVIGEPLPHEKIIACLDDLTQNAAPEGIHAAAQAIMTTDTYAKGASAQITIGGKPISIAGIAKGSGMVAPDMATMLVYIFTDAAIEQAALQHMVSHVNEATFNAITVDGDTSTSDTLLVAATGASGVDMTADQTFKQALSQVMQNLAHQVVRDGEGASKFVEITVTGAETNRDAKIHAMSIANSPLVKTAIAGEDPNWGRIVMAIGKSGAAADRDLLKISFGDVLVAENGWVSPAYREEHGAAVMQEDEIQITVDLGLGEGQFTAWTCDLTKTYIEINAEYRS